VSSRNCKADTIQKINTMEAKIDYSKIEFSPAVPMPVPFDVRKRIQQLHSYLTTPTTNLNTSTAISKPPSSFTRKERSMGCSEST
jgi:hypothetical protein